MNGSEWISGELTPMVYSTVNINCFAINELDGKSLSLCCKHYGLNIALRALSVLTTKPLSVTAYP